MLKEVKYQTIELKDVDEGKRTARIAFAAFGNVDRTMDILKPGAFTKSWNENKDDVALYFNHDDTQAPGLVKGLDADNEYAYADLWFGDHTLGLDVHKMVASGIIKKSSFGYYTTKSSEGKTAKGKPVRNLEEVWHTEVSVLTKMPANPKTHVIEVAKSLNQQEMLDLKCYIEEVDKFCRNTTASDECIKGLLERNLIYKNILSGYDTADTLDGEQSASKDGEDEIKMAIAKISMKLIA